MMVVAKYESEGGSCCRCMYCTKEFESRGGAENIYINRIHTHAHHHQKKKKGEREREREIELPLLVQKMLLLNQQSVGMYFGC